MRMKMLLLRAQNDFATRGTDQPQLIRRLPGSGAFLRMCIALTVAVSTVGAAAAATPAEIYRENIGRVYTVHSASGLGTGFLFRTGHLATNAHVVGDAQSVEIESQAGERFPAKVVYKNVKRDLAVLEFSSPIRPFQALIPLRSRSGSLEIGEGIVVIGSPGGLKGSVTTGIVSQVHSSGAIQLNASVNSGNSGGPVFDMQGRVVGIATRKFREFEDGRSVDGLAIAIPIAWLEGLQ
jgi:S1-C subfamily serine protease